MKYISVDDLQAYCDNQKDHSITPNEFQRMNNIEIVRCKDCKHRPVKPNDYENGFDLEFPDGKCPCQCDDGWYSWYPADNWFCADGERKDGDGE